MEWFSYLEPRTKIHEIIFHSFFWLSRLEAHKMHQTQNVWIPWMKLYIAGIVLNTLLITWHNMLIQIPADTAGKYIYYGWLSQTSNGKSVCCCFEARSYTVAQGSLGLIV